MSIDDPQLRERFFIIDRVVADCRRAAYDLPDMFILSRMDVKRSQK